MKKNKYYLAIPINLGVTYEPSYRITDGPGNYDEYILDVSSAKKLVKTLKQGIEELNKIKLNSIIKGE